jgi:anti-sigma-K factor RskA
MTTQEMIEYALLDAVGLLEESEREAFERAFNGAAPAIRAQVRREQTRFAHIEMLLPDVAPPAHLRAAVLEAVRKAMADEAAQPASLSFVPPMTRSRQVSRWWRAGSLGLATAAAVFMMTTMYLWTERSQLKNLRTRDAMLADLTAQLGPGRVRDVLLDPDTERTVFTRVADRSKAEASIFVSPEWKNKAVFVCAGLTGQPGRPYKLAIIDANDNVVRELAVIEPSGLVTPREIELDASEPVSLAVLAPVDGSRTGEIVSRANLSRGGLGL